MWVSELELLFSRIVSRAVSARSGPYETLIGGKKLGANEGVSLMFPMEMGISDIKFNGLLWVNWGILIEY